MSNSPLQIAISGASGFIGKHHLRHILEEEDAELAAIIDVGPKAKQLAIEHGVPFFATTEDFLAARNAGNLNVDALILATPTSTHVPITKSLVGSRLAVLIEKPLAVSAAEGKELLEAVQGDKDGVYMVGHHRRHDSHAIALKQAIEDQRLGSIVAVNGVWAVRKSDAYFEIPWRQVPGSGGVLLTNTIHEIDLLHSWLGKIVEVYATEGIKDRPYPVESTVQCVFKFESGVLGSFLFSDIATSPYTWEFATGESTAFPKTGETSLSIFGTKGTISVPSMMRFHYDNKPAGDRHWYTPIERDGSARDNVDQVSPYTRQLKHFIAASRREAEPNCSVQDGLRAVVVVEAIFKSLKSRVPVSVEEF